MVLVVSAAMMMSIFSRIENWKRDFTVNHAKLDPRSSDPLLRPLVVSQSPGEIAKLIEQWAEKHSRWSVESHAEIEGGIEIHLTRTTLVMRFIDDIHVRLAAAGDGTRVDAESQSRVGKGDLGQNPRNLRELVSGLREDR
jgi:uncharacterized protein (DUF1499 family)